MPNPPASSPAIERHSSIKNPKAWILGWLPAILGFLTWVATLFRLNESFDYGEVLGIFTAIAISVIIHELAHFIAGRALGQKPWCLRIGYGKTVFDKEFESFRLILKSFPYSGAVHPYAKGSRWERFGFVFAAPLSNAMLLLIALCFVRRSEDPWDFNTISMQMLVANSYLLMFSLVPFYSKTGQPSDGMILFHLIRGTPLKSRDSAKEIRDLAPSWSWMVKHHPPEELLNPFREGLHRPEISLEQRRVWLDAFATCVLMYGANQFLAEADQYSEELLRLKPDECSYKGTRGSVLVEKGDLAAGIKLLEECMKSDSRNDRAISASFLGLACLKQGNRDEALRWLAISREIDPRCISMRRIAKLVESTAGKS